MTPSTTCPQCGAPCHEGSTCETHFHQMLFWESEFPAYGVVHHLTVLCYHLQHPALYSVDGLTNAIQLLTAFVRDGRSPEDVRRASSPHVDSRTRTWKVTARPDSIGTYSQPIHWSMTAADVVAAGSDHYCASVRQWAHSIYDTLQTADLIVDSDLL